MNIILTSAVFTLVIFLAEGVPNVSNDRINSKLLILRFSHLELDKGLLGNDNDCMRTEVTTILKLQT